MESWKFRLHKTTPSPRWGKEDEEFALEILVQAGINIDEVEAISLRECIYLEDHYDVYLLARVAYAG